ncbi:MAG: SRPBCC family protein [Nitrospiraceae bacterium]
MDAEPLKGRRNGLRSIALSGKRTSGSTTICENYKPKEKNMTANTTTQEANELKLVITRVFDAPREIVWRAWTDTECFKQWFKLNDGVTMLSVKMDVRVGGRYRIQTRHPDDEYFTSVGVYREVNPPERLVFTWAWEKDGSEPDFGEVEPPETLVTLEFRARREQTEMVFTQTNFASVQSRDNHNRGWSAYFDQLAKFVKT